MTVDRGEPPRVWSHSQWDGMICWQSYSAQRKQSGSDACRNKAVQRASKWRWGGSFQSIIPILSRTWCKNGSNRDGRWGFESRLSINQCDNTTHLLNYLLIQQKYNQCESSLFYTFTVWLNTTNPTVPRPPPGNIWQCQDFRTIVQNAAITYITYS